MKLVTSHATTDFDGFASCVAVQKLDPEVRIGLSGGFARDISDFLSLHRDRFPYEDTKDLQLDQVRTLILVDVRRRSRLQHVASVLDPAAQAKIVVWDHHPASSDDIRGDEEIVQPVGAVTSLLVEEMIARQIELDPIEATLFALGIHADTGSLSYARTSSRDAAALAWLLGQGARPALVEHFARPPLLPEDRAILINVLSCLEDHMLWGLPIGIAGIQLDEAPPNLGRIVTEALRLTGRPALFCLFRLKRGKCHIIGRSQHEAVPAGSVLEALDGGGHPGAGSAILRDTTLEDAVSVLGDALAARCERPQTVRELMSSPVRTVESTMKLSTLASSLREWRHTGVPVVKDGRLAGVVSFTNVETARREGRLELPVASHMSHVVHTIEPDAPLDSALEKMTELNIGRLPVVDQGRVVGIITRQDVRAFLYQ